MTTLTNAKLHQARRLREEQDMSYADIAENLGFPRDQWRVIREAMHDIPSETAAPTEALAALETKARQMVEAGIEAHGSMQADIRASQGDRPLTEAELATINRIYASGAPISYREIAASLEPPVNWLTVSDAVSHMGWIRPGYKLPPRSTATEEGEAESRREAASLAAMGVAQLQAQAVRVPHSTAATQGDRQGTGDMALMNQGDAEAEAAERQAERDLAAQRAAAAGAG